MLFGFLSTKLKRCRHRKGIPSPTKEQKKITPKIIPLLNVAEFSLFKDGQKSQIGSPTDRNRLNSDATDVRHLPKILGLILLLVEVTTGETGQNVAQKKIVVVVTLKFHQR